MKRTKHSRPNVTRDKSAETPNPLNFSESLSREAALKTRIAGIRKRERGLWEFAKLFGFPHEMPELNVDFDLEIGALISAATSCPQLVKDIYRRIEKVLSELETGWSQVEIRVAEIEKLARWAGYRRGRFLASRPEGPWKLINCEPASVQSGVNDESEEK
jgi:hypothetical protein